MARSGSDSCRSCRVRLDFEDVERVRDGAALALCGSRRCRADLARSPFLYGYGDRDPLVRALRDEVLPRPTREDVAAARRRRGLSPGGLYG